MAESRVRLLSVTLFAALLVLGVALLVFLPTAESVEVIAFSVLITLASLVSAPTPSGQRIRLGIGPAVAASLLLEDPLAVVAAFSLGMATTWLAIRMLGDASGDRHGGFLAETVALAVYGIVAVVMLDSLAEGPILEGWQGLIAVTAGGLAWFLTRAIVEALIGLERADLSARYLWLLALEDWAAVVSVFAAGALFGLTLPVMGLWAVPVSLMPYLFTHVALQQYASTRVTYGQTIRALAQIPEAAGLAPRGHSIRTADLAVAVAKEMGLHPHVVSDVDYAAAMHDVGRITLSEPAILKAGYTDEDLARWGAQIIAEAPYLSRVASIVEEQHRPYRTPGVERDPDVPIESRIIKVASAYDQAVNEMSMPPVEALETIHQGSAYEFDPLVARSLRRVLVHRREVPV